MPGTISLRVGIIMLALLAGACSSERKDEDVRRFFENGARIGYWPDVGLFKLSQLRGEWDYVATIHGMADDMDFCEKVVEGLRRQASAERYSCRTLNQ